VHLGLHPRGVLADEVPHGVPPARHHEVLPRQPQRRAVVAAAVAQVDDARLPPAGRRRGGLAEDAVQHLALAHVGRAGADAAPVRRPTEEVVVGLDAEAAGGVDAARVGVDLGEAAAEAVVLQHGLDEEGVGVAEDAQVAPERGGRADGGRHARVDGRRAQRRGDVAQGPPARVELPHHGVHEGVPRHGGEQALELLREAQAVDHPVVAVDVDDGLVEVEHHHDPVPGGHCERFRLAGFLERGEGRLAGYDACLLFAMDRWLGEPRRRRPYIPGRGGKMPREYYEDA
jgi:hypothetical protein